MGVFQILSRAFTITQKSLNLIVTLFVINFIMSLVGLLAFPDAQVDPANISADVIAQFMGYGLLSALVGIFIQGGSLYYVLHAIKGQDTSLNTFVSGGKKFFLVLLLLGFIIFMLIATVSVIAIGLMALGASGTAGIVGIIAALIGVVLFILALLASVTFVMAPYVIVSKEIGAIPALRESVRFFKANFGKIVGLSLMFFLIAIAIFLIFGLVNAVLIGVSSPTTLTIISGFFNSAISAFFSGVFVPAAFMMLYLSAGQSEVVTNDETSSDNPSDEQSNP